MSFEGGGEFFDDTPGEIPGSVVPRGDAVFAKDVLQDTPDLELPDDGGFSPPATDVVPAVPERDDDMSDLEEEGSSTLPVTPPPLRPTGIAGHPTLRPEASSPAKVEGTEARGSVSGAALSRADDTPREILKDDPRATTEVPVAVKQRAPIRTEPGDTTSDGRRTDSGQGQSGQERLLEPEVRGSGDDEAGGDDDTAQGAGVEQSSDGESDYPGADDEVDVETGVAGSGRDGGDETPPDGAETDDTNDSPEPPAHRTLLELRREDYPSVLNPNIDVPRLFADLGVTEADLRNIAALSIPSDAHCVTSISLIKTDTTAATVHLVRPDIQCDVVGYGVLSGVNEQPLGQETINGALNRLDNGVAAREQVAPGEARRAAWFSVENGLFRVSGQPGPEVVDRSAEGIRQFTAGADLTTKFDPNAEYEDRAVAVIRISGYPTIVQISPGSEAVRFPKDAVMAAANAEGGLAEHTAGSMLAEMGLVKDKQNPHTELTADRPGGPLPRQDQIARVIVRGLLELAREYGSPTPSENNGK
jgi:hypothetical protein